MFRFNSSGHFNIPYGGIAYNTKDFRSKVDHIFSEEVKVLFKNTTIKNQDFEKICPKNQLKKRKIGRARKVKWLQKAKSSG